MSLVTMFCPQPIPVMSSAPCVLLTASSQPAEATNRSLIFQHTWKAAGWAIMETYAASAPRFKDEDGDGNAWTVGLKISRYLFSCVFVVPLYLHNTHIFDHHVWKMVGSWLAGILVGWICCPRDATNPLLAAASPLSGSEYSVPWPLIWRSKVLFASFALVLLLCLSYGSYGEPWNAVISSWVLTLCDGLFGGFLIALSWMTDSRCMSMVMKMAKSTTVMIGILWHIVIKKGTRNVIHS